MLSKRLEEIAKLVKRNKVVFDVGSDHALLPCFLVLNEISPKVYAGDIALGPLNNGIENIKRYGLIDRVIPILSDGLDKAPEDVETVIISGMGYFTIEHILDNCDLNRFLRYMKYHFHMAQSDLLNEIPIKDVDKDFLSKITQADIHAFITYLSIDCRCGPATCASKISTIRIFFKFRIIA